MASQPGPSATLGLGSFIEVILIVRDESIFALNNSLLKTNLIDNINNNTAGYYIFSAVIFQNMLGTVITSD